MTTGALSTSVALHLVQPVHSKADVKDPAAIDPKGLEKLTFKLNGNMVGTKIKPETTLAEMLRDIFKLTGTKVICNHGECGGCTVLLDNKAVYSCQMLALDVEGKQVLTIEGLLREEKLHPLQQAFIDKDGLQCGFCTPGQIMSAYALLTENPKPSKTQILEALSGNLCRCSAYPKIAESVQLAAQQM
jgi:aerobic-type carbon monoxide dehydrogenase small subunit (CoxS/CutS family)